MTSTVYAIGDVQGCCTSLTDLLRTLPQTDSASFWFAGDLINRGPESLQALRTIKSLSERSVCVLGNHDLHLLATAAGLRPPGRRDTLDEILTAPDCNELIDWLRHRPMAWYQHPFLLVHAGVHPDWTLDQTLRYAGEVQHALRGPDWKDFLTDMYGNRPEHWSEQLSGNARLRGIVNVLTRMRMLGPDNQLDMQFKDSPDQAPDDLTPWFDRPMQLQPDVTVLFGHWSTLGLKIQERVISLDSGCVWGGKLSAVRLSDRSLYQVTCSQAPDQAGD